LRERNLPRLTPVANGGFFLTNVVSDGARLANPGQVRDRLAGLLARHPGRHVAPEAAFSYGFGWLVETVRPMRVKFVTEGH
jgi:hypothetical protein